MMLPQLLFLSLTLAPNVVSAAIFPENSLVKMIGHKEFKEAMKQKMTSVVAFVAPWCGHCQRMAPEYSKAALGLHPLVPLYAVDCDAPTNKRLCADQGVKGFPTVKLFPQGKFMDPVEFTGTQRSASEFFYFAERGIPGKVKKVHYIEDIDSTLNAKKTRHRALLMKKPNKMPLLWSVLANKYGDDIEFFVHRDRKGKSSEKMGFERGEDGQSKVLIYPLGQSKPIQYKGIMKLDSLSKFFDSLLDGTADLEELNSEAEAEEFVPDPAELEIEQQQEAERLKLAHGGFANLIDFEAAVRDGSAKNFHGGGNSHLGALPKKKEGEGESSSSSSSSKSSKKIRMPMTDEAGQVVLQADTATATPTAAEVPVDTPERASEPEPETEPEPVKADAEDKIDTKEGPAAPEPPVEPSAEAESERPKDEL